MAWAVLTFKDGQWQWASNNRRGHNRILDLRRPNLLDDASLDVDFEIRGAQPYLGLKFVLLIGS